MQSHPGNPPSNKLPTGLSEAQVVNAVEESGYPLQIVVSEMLRSRFFVQQEWNYIDEDTKQLRAIDILAEQRLYNIKEKPQPRIRPTLNLLVECKQSDLPYVFFLSPEKVISREFPAIAGLFDDSIRIITDNDPSSWRISIIDALGLTREPFILKDVEYSMTFSKCVRKGPSVELSGTEAFQGLVLPLVKSLRYFQKHEAPPKTAFYHDCHLVLAVAVLDAPMVAVRVRPNANETIHMPWIRVVRHESIESEDWTERSRRHAIDVVHKDFFETWINTHVAAYGKRFSEAALRHQTEIATGQGFVPDMWANRDKVEENLRPRLKKENIGRMGLIARNIGAKAGKLISGPDEN